MTSELFTIINVKPDDTKENFPTVFLELSVTYAEILLALGILPYGRCTYSEFNDEYVISIPKIIKKDKGNGR